MCRFGHAMTDDDSSSFTCYIGNSNDSNRVLRRPVPDAQEKGLAVACGWLVRRSPIYPCPRATFISASTGTRPDVSDLVPGRDVERALERSQRTTAGKQKSLGLGCSEHQQATSTGESCWNLGAISPASAYHEACHEGYILVGERRLGPYAWCEVRGGISRGTGDVATSGTSPGFMDMMRGDVHRVASSSHGP